MGLVKILRFSCISPEVNMSWLNIITFSGGSMACSHVAFISWGVVALFSRWLSSYGLNFGDMSCISRAASLKHEFGWGHPLF